MIMVNNKDVYIHLGLHKTGTTFFQKIFYPSYPEFNYKHLRAKEVLADFNQYILRENELTFNFDKAASLFYQNLSKKETIERIFTLCEEQYSGFPLQDAYNRKIIFDRLNTFFPNANYILVLRNQKDFIRSMYAEYLKKGGTASLLDFLKRKDSQLNFARGGYLRYFTYYDYIRNKVPEERIKVLYYEDLKYQPALFYKNLLDFFKLDLKIDLELIKNKKNVSFSNKKFEAVRFYNRIGKTSYGRDHLISRRFRKYIIDTYQTIVRKSLDEEEKIINDFVKFLELDNSELPDYHRIKKYNY